MGWAPVTSVAHTYVSQDGLEPIPSSPHQANARKASVKHQKIAGRGQNLTDKGCSGAG